MSYATRPEMIARYGEQDLIRLTDRDGALDAINDAALDPAMNDANAEANSYIAKRVALPLDAPPQALVLHACAIALYRLMLRGASSRASAQARTGYEDALSYLRRIASGELSLGDETPGHDAIVSPGPVFEEGPGRDFTRKTLTGF